MLAERCSRTITLSVYYILLLYIKYNELPTQNKSTYCFGGQLADLSRFIVYYFLCCMIGFPSKYDRRNKIMIRLFSRSIYITFIRNFMRLSCQMCFHNMLILFVAKVFKCIILCKYYNIHIILC